MGLAKVHCSAKDMQQIHFASFFCVVKHIVGIAAAPRLPNRIFVSVTPVCSSARVSANGTAFLAAYRACNVTKNFSVASVSRELGRAILLLICEDPATLFTQSRTVETGKVYLLHILCSTVKFCKSHVSSDVILAASEPIKKFHLRIKDGWINSGSKLYSLDLKFQRLEVQYQAYF
jgi:hypothetical protein